uniref:Uncharacterized protein n=1 Tax=Utricularia reniformis TaxID=192314 RepID=A0A1Y0B1L5_9LAMI|nr:hypothetical protein AEK19_MT1065 [Utricularia reniformis]ART31287.1 hypothetical protein AEK19_MT1065 [Utricularia reniformis]
MWIQDRSNHSRGIWNSCFAMINCGGLFWRCFRLAFPYLTRSIKKSYSYRIVLLFWDCICLRLQRKVAFKASFFWPRLSGS